MPEPIELPARSPLRERHYAIERGWSDDLAERLVEASKEAQIMRYTPNDAAERFPSPQAAHEWYEQKQPVIYALNRAAALAGVIWYSHRPRPELAADHTFAIRMYDTARGKGLTVPFMSATEADFRAVAHPTAIWLETDMDNSPARNLYRKIGYKVVAATPARITMRR